MYKLISNSNVFTEDILDVVCKNRGVDKNKIMNPSFDDVIHYSKLKNMDRAVQFFKTITKRESSELAIVVDSDPD